MYGIGYIKLWLLWIYKTLQNKDNQLVIIRGKVHHSGYYQCVASNEAGTVSAFLRVDIFMQSRSWVSVTMVTLSVRSSVCLMFIFLQA